MTLGTLRWVRLGTGANFEDLSAAALGPTIKPWARLGENDGLRASVDSVRVRGVNANPGLTRRPRAL